MPLHEVVQYCYEYQLLQAEAQQGGMPPARVERLQALARLLADPAQRARSHDRFTLRCVGYLQLTGGLQPACVLDIGASGLSVAVPPEVDVPPGAQIAVIVPDIVRRMEYVFPCAVRRVDPDVSGRKVAVRFEGRPLHRDRPAESPHGATLDAEAPAADARPVSHPGRAGLEELLTPAGGTPSPAGARRTAKR